ncbi:hypothetical protein BRPE64_ACDS21410 [Caballeronia insecticola]|uniref:Uncharacterized protein n=1 Tax=Caballeronia insecticola TaxID=758793 RepID=R4WSG9_9BURK|nr:hypothetical protein BRPE64_ACDS21410 [Caballeronia insecticola]
MASNEAPPRANPHKSDAMPADHAQLQAHQARIARAVPGCGAEPAA